VGDALIGLPSSGLHSNGFSLVRKIVDEKLRLVYDAPCPWDANTTITVGETLLTPTRIYIKYVLPAVRQGIVKGMSHITGGGFTENIPRILPRSLGCFVDATRWQRPPIFSYLQKHGNVASSEMARTFNNGIGLVVIVSPQNVDAFVKSVHSNGLAGAVKIGEVTDTPGVDMRGLDKAWV
jgi:phosphoribosylamine--glycine ligase/phosphoribosylformylglycinamidine cyclo-ligase